MTHRRSAQKILLLMTTVALIVSLALLGYFFKQYSDAGRLYDNIAQIAFDADTNENEISRINHAALAALNEDYVAWIQVDGTEISYPIVQSRQELYYLRRDFYRENSFAGTIFMDFRNNKDFSDTNTMIFGHNLRDGSMFAPLQEFIKSEFFNSNRFIHIDTPDRTFVYEIFAAYETVASKVPNYAGMLAQEQLDELMGQVNSLATQSSKIEVTPQDRILTLSTCGYSIKTARIIVHAKLVQD